VRLSTQVLHYPLRRGTLVNLSFFALSLVAAYKISAYIVAGDNTSLALAGMVFVGGALVVAILNDWKKGVYFLFTWLLFEDFARKFLGNNMAVYFAKDFLLAVVYLSFFMAWRRKDKDLEIFRPPFLLPLLALVWFGAMQIFNPASTHITYGLMGIRLYFYYVPLLVVGFALVDSEKALQRFFFVNLSLLAVIVLLGIVQSVIGPRFLNPPVMADDIRLLSEAYRVAPISGVSVYRPTSVFVSAGRFGDLLIVGWLIVFGFSGYLLLRRGRGRVFAFLTLTLTAAACLMCASRGVFMWSSCSSIVGGIAFIWGAPWRQREAPRMIRVLQRAALGVSLAVVLLLFTYPDAFLNRIAVYSETLDPRSPTSELVHRTRDYPLANFLAAFDYPRWLYGYGIGTASLGGQYVSRLFNARPPEPPVESGYGNLILEMGIGGLILWLIMSFAVVFSSWKIVRKLRGSPLFPLGFMIFLYAFIVLFPITFTGIQGYQDFILNSYLWLLVGVLFRLPKLALSPQFAAGAPSFGTGGPWIR
jgi:hypothetical protein